MKSHISFSRIVFSIFIMLMLFSCVSKNNEPEFKSVPVERMQSSSLLKDVDLNTLVSLKDTICGMSLKSGVSDTLHQDEKIYGFCSPGCKEKFKKALAKK